MLLASSSPPRLSAPLPPASLSEETHAPRIRPRQRSAPLYPSDPIGRPGNPLAHPPCTGSTAPSVNRPPLPPMARKTPSPYKSLCISNPLETKQPWRNKNNIIGEEEEMVDEAWERAVEAALHAGGEGSASPARSLTLDGAVKCMHGRLPAAEILERHQSLEHLSIAGVGVTSLEGFPRLRNLTRLTLSDNRIAGGLDHLVAAGLSSLRDLDLSNNRIQDVDDLAPLADLRLVSLDLYECPVTRVKDYRSRVFGMIRTLKYLDKMDADENERPESDDDDDDGDGEGDAEGDGDGDEDDDDEEDEDDPGSGEVANGGVSHSRGGVASHPVEVNGVIDVDEEESDADEVVPNGGVEHHHGVNGFRVAAAGEAPEEEDEDEEDDEDFEEEEEDDLGEEIDEDGDDDDAVVEVHDVPSSDDEEDGVEVEDDEEDDEEEEVEDEGEEAEPQSSGRVAMMTGEDGGEEIDGHEHGEGDDEDENGEIGEEDDEGSEADRGFEGGNEDEDAEDEDEDTEYLVQPIVQPQPVPIGSDFDAADPDDADEDRDEVDDDDEGVADQPSSSQGTKRKRDDDDPSGSGDDSEDDGVEDLRPFKHH